MLLSKTTTRAIAFSVALVAAGATVAGAAVFQLPILGFGRASTASAAVVPARHPAASVRKVRPKVIIKTRIVDDIVHLPAPVATSGTRTSTRAAIHSLVVFTPTSTTVSAPTLTPATPSPPAPKPALGRSGHYDDGHEQAEVPISADHVDNGGFTGTPATDR